MLVWFVGLAVAVSLVLLLLRRSSSSKVPTTPPAVARTVPRKVLTKKTGKSYLVTGGHGMLGSHLVEALLAREEEDITIFDVTDSKLFEKERKEGKVHFVQGNLLDLEALAKAVKGKDTVFHTAALVNYWSRLSLDKDKIYNVNYIGTKNVVELCQEAGVKQLVHTSTASLFVVPKYKENPLRDIDETLPYPEPPYLCHYTETKLLAEKFVLSANGRKGLLTAAVRPNGIYGPREQILTVAIAKGSAGIGTRTNKQSYVYVENLVHAMLCIEDKLVPGSQVGGQAYFISNDKATSYYDFNVKFEGLYGFKFKLLPNPLVVTLAYVSEFLTWISNGRIPLGELAWLTPITLTLCRADLYFSTEKAKKELGWTPIYSEEEGMEICYEYQTALMKKQ
jgi:nucleoside-diphosphate-sugar epimerase